MFKDWFYDVEKGIKKSFCFLPENGFKMSARSVNSETDVWYSGTQAEINVTSYWGLDDNYKSRQVVEVILTVDGKRENLLRMEKLFGAEILAALRDKLQGHSIREKVETYAEFIKEHLGKLL